jgi:hypothetical protein
MILAIQSISIDNIDLNNIYYQQNKQKHCRNGKAKYYFIELS